MDNLIQKIINGIPNLNNLIEYKNLTGVFELPLIYNTIQILPNNILEE